MTEQDVLKRRHDPCKETSKPVGFTQDTIAPQIGEPVDVTPFGEFRSWDDGRDIGVLWEEMRDVFKVVVEFADGETPDPEAVKLQYWQSSWPFQKIPRDEASGSGNSGWLNIGDWFKGAWTNADTELQIDGNKWTYTFRPLNAKECPDLPDFNPTYRSTFKARLLFTDRAPELTQFRAFTDSIWEKMGAVVEWTNAEWDGKAEIFNGHIEKASNAQIDFYYAKPISVNSFDETVVTVRNGERSFSFAAKDLAQGRVFVRDYGVLVRRADDHITYAEMEKAYASAPKDVYRRIDDMPEQTLTKAWSDMPAKNRIYMPVCVEGGRQYFRLHVDGAIMHDRNWLRRIPSSDTPKADWPDNAITVRFGIPQGQRSGATIEEGYLPIPITWWENDGLRVMQTLFVTTFSGKLPPEGRVAGEEPLACMVKLAVTNYTDSAKSLRLPLKVHLTDRGDRAMWPEVIADESLYEPLVVNDGVVSGHTDKERVRFFVDCNGAAKLTPDGTNLLCDIDVPAQETREFYVTIPFLTPGSPEEIKQLKSLRYDEQHEMIAGYWQKRTFENCIVTTPEPMLNSFYWANASHQLINTQNEVGKTNTAMANVGTGSYGVFPNESIMMIVELDRRGYHDVAEKALQSFIEYQGTVALPGDYSNQDGVYTGTGGYDEGGYNQNQGWVLWGIAEHYWFTQDTDWLRRVAPSLIKGCDWIINERLRTKTEECIGIRAIEYGLLPPGSLEDVADWRCWRSNNDYSYWGLDNAARVLAEIGHPEAERLLKEAAEYKQDIINAYWEATVRAPVVGLRDGTYIPYTPSEVHRRGRSWGWISETLAGGIHFIRCGVVDPDSDWAKWIMQDYEDNRYISEQYGYQTPYFERDWFSIGGFSQQPSLVCSPTPYLVRDEIKHYLRTYFNSFASSYFPERAMLTEHPLPNLGNWQGGHFKSSDEAMNTSWIRWMFIWDEGIDLHLGRAIPRYWLADGKEIKIERAETHFGQMSMSMKSFAKSGKIEMTITPPTRNLPGVIYARFRHPEGKSMNRVTVNSKSYANFVPAKEWVILPPLKEKTVVVAYYD
ncbi:MAG: hypothetical protein Q7N50_05470 [Armatimonadota bacterium]|nr:hypothetical protein [Armatimonadota bacterium]